MHSIVLTPRSPFGTLAPNVESVTLSAPTGLALVSVAASVDSTPYLAERIESAYGATVPDVGSSSLSADGTARLLRLQLDQLFLLFDYDGDRAVEVVAGKLDGIAYYTDQSDGWAILRLSGPATLAVLERVSMLDLDPDIFAVDAVARTIMEQLNVIIVRERRDSFLLLSPRSSAQSLLHAIELSIANTV